jgi:hypothetical protein
MRCGGLLLLFTFSCMASVYAQDTTRLKKNGEPRENSLAQQVRDAISRTPRADTLIDVKSEDYFIPYEGKIIRKITINQLGFDRTVQDTTQRFKTTMAKVANWLHNDTRAWVIRNNVFLREGEPLNPYRAADNERYLRDLEFILDSRIFIVPISEDSDSVDLLVMTRDVFSLGASLYPRSETEYRFKVQEANLAGMGQRLQVSGIYDTERNPRTGMELLYKKTNLFGSFVNATVAYTEINTGQSIGEENESAFIIRVDRPLFHPFARWAGAAELSRNWSRNTFGREDSLFLNYNYTIRDLWAGYSFGHSKLPNSLAENRNRKFIAVRMYDEYFHESPEQSIPNRRRLTYADRSTALGQLTFFKQDFYKTRYVAGFGRTEDIPYGYRISLTAGWEKELGKQRPYTGAELLWSVVNTTGTFVTYGVKLGNYWSEDLIEDALAQVFVNRYSRLYTLGKSNVRHEMELGYAAQLNQVLKRQLDIRDVNGIYGFRPDSLSGARRLMFRTETVVYPNWKVLGFKLAPVARIDLAFLGKENQPLLKKENFFSGYSVALRARNENLIFNTVEARIYYFPTTVEAVDNVRLEFRANFRIKYPTNLVTAPATVYDL